MKRRNIRAAIYASICMALGLAEFLFLHLEGGYPDPHYELVFIPVIAALTIVCFILFRRGPSGKSDNEHTDNASILRKMALLGIGALGGGLCGGLVVAVVGLPILLTEGISHGAIISFGLGVAIGFIVGGVFACARAFME